MSLPPTFKRAAFLGKGEPLNIQEVSMIYPGKDEVLVKVEACGVCYSDVYAQMDAMGAGFPIVPGHEIIGHIVALGEGVTAWKIGDRVGSGWHGFHDGTCHACRAGYFQMCDNRQVNGVSHNGGYAEFTLLSPTSLSFIPSHLPAAPYAPILCAGLTVFNTLLHQPSLTPGSTVAIHGLGGLGHLAIQYANKCGYRVVAISRGKDKEDLARHLGAHEYVDTKKRDAAEALRELGSARVVITTSPDGEEIKGLLGGLGPEGRLVVLSVPQGGKVDVDIGVLMKYGLSISSWPSGHAEDAEEAVRFTELAGVECMVEEFPLDRANDAFNAMLNGTVRFRSVITFK